MKLKPLPRMILIALSLVGVYFGVQWGIQNGYVPSPTRQESSVPKRVKLPEVQEPRPSTYPPPARPQGRIVDVTVGSGGTSADSSGEIRFEIWAWNGQAGLILANGGATTTPDSLIGKRGVKVRLTRQDDVNQMQNDLLVFAKGLADGQRNPSQGVAFVNIMGDGTPAFFAGLNPQLERLCPDCTAVAIAGIGYSRGEDAFLAPPEVKADPQNARGLVVAGVLRDGDWNIVLKWAADNEIPNNPDETTYDPKAINWVAAESYTKAAEMYAQGYCEERPVVGTVQKKEVCVSAVTTWTPGDVTVARQRGGLVRIISTKEYRWQMGTTMIGIKRFVKQNRDAVMRILEATYEAGDQIKRDPAQLRKAMELSAAVYQEEDADYWLRYYKGVTERDKQGLMVELGGSTVNNLADGAHFFGLAQGGLDLLSAVYNDFGDILVQQYPRLVPSYLPYDTVVDRTLVEDLVRRASTAMPTPDVPTFTPAQQVQAKIGDRAWEINFETGKATFTQSAQSQLEALLNQTVIAGSALVEVHGHTDNTGNAAFNMKLSQARAQAVKTWLQGRAPALFTDGRVRVVAHGQTQPLVPNDSPTNMAKNRRVQVVLGTTS